MGVIMRVENIALQVDSANLLSNCNFEFFAGEFVGIIGPNGAGKSSLLKILAGVLEPSSGNVWLTEQQTIRQLSAVARAKHIGYLAQQEKSAWPITVEDLILLSRLPWRDEKDIARLAPQLKIVLEKTDTAHLSSRVVTTLSGGELQRVLLARVIMGDPEIIIADEPIAALDINHQLQVMELLKEFSAQQKKVVAALHDLSLAARFCDRIVLLQAGQVIANGNPVDVLTAEHLARVYGIKAHVECRDDCVIILPVERLT